MKILKAFPPNYVELKRVFNLGARTDVIFSYGDTIYAPGGNKIHPALIAHEEAHGERQRDLGVAEWWRHYIENPKFRLGEEIIGHRAEWRQFKQNSANSRKAKDNALAHICKRLSGPLYLGLITYDAAVAAVTDGI